MVISENKQGNIDIITLSGRFVMAETLEVRKRLKNLIDSGTGKLIIDMEKVSFIDSSACAALISAFKQMQIKSGHLILVTSPIVQSLLELTRLDSIFEIHSSLSAAVDSFAADGHGALTGYPA